MKFFDSFWKKSFYIEGKAVSFWGAFGKAVLVAFLMSIVYAFTFYFTFGIRIPAYLYSYGVQALNGYPSNLVLTFDKEGLSKNIEGVLHLYPIPEGKIGSVRMEDSLPGYIFTITDKENVSIDAFSRANSLVLLAKDGIVTHSDRETKILSYGDLIGSHEKVVITKNMISEMVSVVNMYAPSIPYLIAVSIIVLYAIFAPIGYLLITLFTGLVIMLLSSVIIRRKVAYDEAYVLGMYALAPVVILQAGIEVIPYVNSVVSYIPFFGTFASVGFLWYMFRVEAKNTKPVTKEESVSEVKPVKKVTKRKKKEVSNL